MRAAKPRAVQPRTARPAVFALSADSIDGAIRAVNGKLNGKQVSAWRRRLTTVFRAGELRVAAFDSKKRGLNTSDTLHVASALLCAMKGLPLVVRTSLANVDMDERSRLDIYMFDNIAGAAERLVVTAKAADLREREKKIFERLTKKYRNVARNGSAIDFSPAPDAGDKVAFGRVPLQWRRLVLPVITNAKHLDVLMPYLSRLVTEERRLADVHGVLED